MRTFAIWNDSRASLIRRGSRGPARVRRQQHHHQRKVLQQQRTLQPIRQLNVMCN